MNDAEPQTTTATTTTRETLFSHVDTDEEENVSDTPSETVGDGQYTLPSSSRDRQQQRYSEALGRKVSRWCNCLDTFVDDFRQLKKSPRYLVTLYVVAFLDSLAYFAFSYALIMHLGMEVGLSDSTSGLFYGIFGICISVSTLVLGFAADMLGMRNSICISAAVGFVSRLGMAYAVLGRSTWLSASFLFILVGPSIALIGPPIPTGIKRYTTRRTTNIAFAIYYGVMNVAAFIATPIVDMLRIHSQGESVLLLPPYALIIAITSLIQVPIFFMALFGIYDVNLRDDGTLGPVVNEDHGKPLKERVRNLLHLRDFWRAVTVVACQIGVKSSFRYFDALYLPYVMRAYQDADTFPYLSLLAVNPVIVIAATLTGAITIVTGQFHPVTSMIIGTFIGGVAPFWMAVGPYLWPIIFYVLFTSVGEVIWSPISYSYLVSLTSDGDEGAWMALAGMPVFLAKMLTGSLTGGLLSRFCPNPSVLCPLSGTPPPSSPSHIVCPVNVNGTALPLQPAPPQMGGDPNQCNGAAIWGIIGATTITSFFLLIAFRKFIREGGTEIRTDKNAIQTILESDEDEATARFKIAQTLQGNHDVFSDDFEEEDDSANEVADFGVE